MAIFLIVIFPVCFMLFFQFPVSNPEAPEVRPGPRGPQEPQGPRGPQGLGVRFDLEFKV